MVVATRASSAWERYAWVAGILYVIALVAETVVGLLGGAEPERLGGEDRERALRPPRAAVVITYLSVVYAAMFLIYLGRLYDLLRGNTDRSRFLGSWCWLAERSLLPCMLSATSVSSACSARSSCRSGSSTIRACPTRCT